MKTETRRSKILRHAGFLLQEKGITVETHTAVHAVLRGFKKPDDEGLDLLIQLFEKWIAEGMDEDDRLAAARKELLHMRRARKSAKKKTSTSEIEWVKNDAGYRSMLRDGGFDNGRGPCAPIAIANLTGEPLIEVVEELNEIQNRRLPEFGLRPKSCLNGTLKAVSEEFMAKRGWVKIIAPAYCTWRAFERSGFAGKIPNALVGVTRHLTCLKDGKLVDPWDCRGRQGRKEVWSVIVPADKKEVAEECFRNIRKERMERVKKGAL